MMNLTVAFHSWFAKAPDNKSTIFPHRDQMEIRGSNLITDKKFLHCTAHRPGLGISQSLSSGYIEYGAVAPYTVKPA